MSAARSGARVAVLAALAVLLGLFALNEIVAMRDRAAPEETDVDRDVGPARDALASALVGLERTCAGAADAALSRTADVSDPNALFAALGEIALPDGAGIVLEDSNRRVLAWSGTTLDDSAFADMPRTSDGTSLVATLASRRLAVRRTRSSPRALEGAPFLAVCHVPIAESFPLRNRALVASSVAAEVAAGFRVAEDVRILAPDAAEGEPVRSAFGGTFAKLDVRPLSARSWNEAVAARAGERRSAILAAVLLLAAAAAWNTASKAREPWLRHAAHAMVALAARVALGSLSISKMADLGPLTDAARYSHAFALDLAGSPLSLLLTCVAAAVAAAGLHHAAECRTARIRSPWPSFVAALATAALCRGALAGLVHDVVDNSSVEFFSAEAVLPAAASAVLLAALLAAGVAAVSIVAAAWAALRPTQRPAPARALASALVLGATLAPFGPGSPHAAALAVAAVAGATAALAAHLLGAAAAVRMALVPLGVAVALFAPLESELHEATRAAVRRAATAHVARTAAAERLSVGDTLDGAAEDMALQTALAAGRLPRDLALSLWTKSPLARRTGGSSLEIEPAPGRGERQAFSADLPPVRWLPSPASYPEPGKISEEPLPGQLSGADGTWIVGVRHVEIDGRVAATLRVVLEHRPTAQTLPELQVLGASRADDTREAPPLRVTHYTAEGKLTETDDPYRPAGAPLDAELRRDAVERENESWRTSLQPDRELMVYVRPYVEDGEVTGVDAFSYDTGGSWALLLRGTRAALCGALVSLVAVLCTARTWARRARLRLAQRLVVSYVLVAALPLSFLGWANRAIALQRVEETTNRELNEAIALLRTALHDDPLVSDVASLPPAPDRLEDIRPVAYAIGHHANVFQGPRLVATSDQGLFDTELLPTRLPASVYRNVILLGLPFDHTDATVGGYRFDVGYAPLRGASGEVAGAMSVPLLHQRRLRDRELASAMTAVLGLYLASLIAAVAVGTWLAGRMTRPLSDLTAAAKRVARGDLERPVEGGGPDELGEVVTAFNQMQHDLGESRAKLVKAEKEAAWRDMARQVAHEVKNPLTPMRLAAEHLRRAWRDHAPNFDEVLERGVDLIVRQTESLQRIATAFGDFARFPNRRREPVDVPPLLDEVLDLYRGSPGLTIERHIARPLPPLSADPDELRRVFVNLAKNAVEALDGRAGTLTASLRADGGSLVLTMADDGPGIPDDILPRLFEPYLSTKTKGTGLGLAICKRAVEDLGGTIAIESRPGAGTTVTVRLPMTASSPAEGGVR